MIDTQQFMRDLESPLSDIFNGQLQIWRANQEVPTEQLDKNRIVYNMTAMPSNYPRQSIEQFKKVVESTNPNFEKDIIQTSVLYPEATLSISAFGDNAIKNLQKIREWFNIPGRGDEWLRFEYDCTIREIMGINNRTVYIETNYENRYGFDVILNFRDVVEDRIDTIEKVVVNNQVTGTTKEYDI